MSISVDAILALVILLLVTGFYGYAEHGHVATLTTELAGAKQQITADGTALAQEKLTAKAFQEAAADWQAKCAPASEATQAAAAVATLQAQLTTARQQLRAQETQDAKLPACAAVLAQDLGTLCPDIAGGLRGVSGAPGNLRGPAGAGAGAGSSDPAP